MNASIVDLIMDLDSSVEVNVTRSSVSSLRTCVMLIFGSCLRTFA